MTDVRKVWVIATTEYGSAVRTKAFLIGILLLPLIMGSSILIQIFVAKRVDTAPRRFAVLDQTGELYPAIEKAAQARNAAIVGKDGKQIGPRFDAEQVSVSQKPADEVQLELSERVRRNEIQAFVEVPPTVFELPKTGEPDPQLLYYSDNPNDSVVRSWLAMTINDLVRAHRCRAAKIDQQLADRLNRSVDIENLGLLTRAAGSEATGQGGAIKAAEKVDPVRTAGVPAAMLFVMFFVIMTSAPQLLNTVIEEKMSRISEVLLGSVTPFELMLGKLLGNVGIALTLAALYVGGGFAVAVYHGYGDVVRPELLAALALFLVLGISLYGSLYMAVGSACNDLKDAQSLMMPIVLLSVLPMFFWTAVLANPASSLSVGMSLFPPSSPFLMLMRLGLKPSPPVWQVVLSVVLTTLTALACVWAAGKIFRTGLLMQGKTPSFAELARWVMAK